MGKFKELDIERKNDMTIVEVITSDKKKCGSCVFFVPNENDWFCGKCMSETTKVHDKDRFYTSKQCSSKISKYTSRN